MKRKLTFTITLILLLTLLTSCANNFEQVDEAIRPEIRQNLGESSDPEIGIHTIIEEEDYQTISVHFPVTGIEKVDAILEGFALNRIELFRQETASLKLIDDDRWPFELHLEFEIIYESERHLSLIFNESKYLGGPQSNITMYTYNFNLEQGRQLALKDLFKGSSAYLEILSQNVLDQLINQNALNIALDEEWVIEGSKPLEANFKHFLMKENGIVVLFEKYQLGPAFIGEPSLEIPYEVFSAHIELKEIILVSNVIPETSEITTESEATSESEFTTEETTAETTTESLPDAPSKSKRIALTFEDGPHPLYTSLILDTLKSRDQKATFFLLGNRAVEYPELTIRIANEGHLIGNHTWSHPQLTRLSNEELLNQIDKTNTSIFNLTGFVPTLYRPPYGIYNENVITLANRPAILWSIDPLDLKYKDSDYITNYILDHAFDGAIILLRDTNPYTTQSLSAIIDGLERSGYEIVTVDELLNLTPENSLDNVRIFSRGTENK